ncbi:MAG: hypothetical protein AVDCRST_MAG19-1154, partial [uncultured Thermomicrobiales bacterium]
GLAPVGGSVPSPWPRARGSDDRSDPPASPDPAGNRITANDSGRTPVRAPV